MRVLILGADGYLGWPTSMHFAQAGHDVCLVDNYLRRNLARQTNSEPLMETAKLEERVGIFSALTERQITVHIGDCTDYPFLSKVVRDFAPDTIIHYAELPSAPYSMMGFKEARTTIENNLSGTFNVIWAMLEYAPKCHLIKLGTMGEYGTPNIDIEEGWINIAHEGRTQRFLYPREGGSLYHTTKILDTDLLWFYVRAYGLRVTDLMQGPVYGLESSDSNMDPRLGPNFHYDDIFGTVVNRFIVQAVAGIPLTVYGVGNQTRGFLNLKDTLECVKLAAMTPAVQGELRIFNQFTELFTINEVATKVQSAAKQVGFEVTVHHLTNPRGELEDHYYKPKNPGLLNLGLKPHLMTDEVLAGMIESVRPHKHRIDHSKILPRVRWNNAAVGKPPLNKPRSLISLD